MRTQLLYGLCAIAIQTGMSVARSQAVDRSAAASSTTHIVTAVPIPRSTPVTQRTTVPFRNVRVSPLDTRLVKCYPESIEANCTRPLNPYCGISRCPRQP